MPAFDFTPLAFGLGAATFSAFAVACVTTTDGRSFIRVFSRVAGICGGAVTLSGLAAWVAWGIYFS